MLKHESDVEQQGYGDRVVPLFKEMLAKFRDMRISEGQGSKEVSDQEMGNT